jgi:hypothetical protein
MKPRTPKSLSTKSGSTPPVYSRTIYSYWRTRGDELAIQGLEKVKEWEDNLGDDLPGTTGDTYPGSYAYGPTRVLHL